MKKEKEKELKEGGEGSRERKICKLMPKMGRQRLSKIC